MGSQDRRFFSFNLLKPTAGSFDLLKPGAVTVVSSGKSSDSLFRHVVILVPRNPCDRDVDGWLVNACSTWNRETLATL